jgi:hypothetical protein
VHRRDEASGSGGDVISVAGLRRYPVKSMLGVDLRAADVSAAGGDSATVS